MGKYPGSYREHVMIFSYNELLHRSSIKLATTVDKSLRTDSNFSDLLPYTKRLHLTPSPLTMLSPCISTRIQNSFFMCQHCFGGRSENSCWQAHADHSVRAKLALLSWCLKI